MSMSAPWSSTQPSISPTFPHSGSIKYLGEETAVVAHVAMIKEEVEEAVVAPTTTEPEVAKKGKTDAPADAPAVDAKAKK